MPLTYAGKEVDRVTLNGNVITNIVQLNGETVLEDNVILATSYTGNPTLTSFTGEDTVSIAFTSNNKEYTGMKITSTYLYYISDIEETNVYSFANNSWAELYKPVTFKNKTFVDSSFYDWFCINYIKS